MRAPRPGITLAAALALSSCQLLPPDVSECHLAHGFVLGAPFDHPGAIEIWDCRERTVVKLIEFRGSWRDRQQRERDYFSAQPGDQERIVGCKDDTQLYAGVVALVPVGPGGPLPEPARAWTANLGRWTFEETPPAAIVCR